ncbi:KDM5C adjacent transcript isoform X2 [Symphalangus syndactylus]|uniref:KDM5C adjacent transcript isoform X2 n=1 Tax=Symphalangus syndactylus TaxID=9590 RepID=UPI003005F7C0
MFLLGDEHWKVLLCHLAAIWTPKELTCQVLRGFEDGSSGWGHAFVKGQDCCQELIHILRGLEAPSLSWDLKRRGSPSSQKQSNSKWCCKLNHTWTGHSSEDP